MICNATYVLRDRAHRSAPLFSSDNYTTPRRARRPVLNDFSRNLQGQPSLHGYLEYQAKLRGLHWGEGLQRVLEITSSGIIELT